MQTIDVERQSSIPVQPTWLVSSTRSPRCRAMTEPEERTTVSFLVAHIADGIDKHLWIAVLMFHCFHVSAEFKPSRGRLHYSRGALDLLASL